MLLKIFVAFILLVHFGDAILKMGLKRHELKTEKFAKHRIQHYTQNQRQIQKSRAGRFATGKSGLSDVYHYVYTVDVSFGTPPQVFKLVPDTTETSTWIVDSSIDDDREPEYKYCKNKACFNSNVSSTYIEDGRKFVSNYNGTEEGILGIDTVQLGELTISNVTFGQASYAYYLEDEKLDGVLGLSFESISKDGVESLFATAVREEVVDAPIFTIWINSSASENKSHGQITWGGLDSEHCSPDVVYFPSISKIYAEFKLDGYSINDGKKETTNWLATSDLISSFIYVPDQAFRDLVEIVNANYNFYYNFYAVDCNVKFNWTIYAGDKALTIDEKVGVFSLKLNDDATKCFLSVESSSYANYDVVLGAPFFGEWCAIHDISAGLIGYARSISK